MIAIIAVSYFAVGWVVLICLACTWKGGEKRKEAAEEVRGWSGIVSDMGFIVFLFLPEIIAVVVLLFWPVYLVIRISNLVRKKKRQDCPEPAPSECHRRRRGRVGPVPHPHGAGDPPPLLPFLTRDG